VQLLGPGYAGRIPDVAAWHEERAGGEAVLLEHRHLPTWFDSPFVPFGHRVPDHERDPPDVLSRARAELASILYSPGAIGHSGYVDADDGL
jgi:hypothetical protein